MAVDSHIGAPTPVVVVSGEGTPVYITGFDPGSLPQSTTPGTSLPAAITSLVAIGDSITAGGATANTAQSWANEFAASLDLPLTNNAISGARLNTAGFYAAYALSPSAAVGTITIAGTNEMADAGVSSANRTLIGNGLQTLATWLALPTSQKVLGSAMTQSGSWTTNTQLGLNSTFSTSANATLTGTVTGTVVYVASWIATGINKAWDVSIDGVSQGPFTFNGQGALTSTGAYPQIQRFAGLSSGSHTVVVTATTGGSDAIVQWIGGNGTSPQTPFVGIGGAMQQNAVANGTVTALNTEFSTNITNLIADGLNVLYVDDYSAITNGQTPPTFNQDNLHPNALGSSLIAAKWLSTLYTPLSFPAGSGVNGDALAQTLYLGGATPETLLAMYQWYKRQAALPENVGGLGKVLTQYIIGTGLLFAAFPGQLLGNGVDLTAQGAAISATTLLATSTNGGMFRIDWVSSVTTVDGTSSTLGGSTGFQIIYTDGDDSVVKTTPVSVTSAANTTGTSIGGSIVVNAKNSTNIQYQMGYTSNTPGQMKYNLHIRFTKLS